MLKVSMLRDLAIGTSVAAGLAVMLATRGVAAAPSDPVDAAVTQLVKPGECLSAADIDLAIDLPAPESDADLSPGWVVRGVAYQGSPSDAARAFGGSLVAFDSAIASVTTADAHGPNVLLLRRSVGNGADVWVYSGFVRPVACEVTG